MQFDFMPERGTIYAVFLLRRMQEEYHTKEKRCMRFVDQEKAFDRVPREVLEWAMRKKRIPEVLVRSVMSLYERENTMVMVDFELSEEFVIIFGKCCHLFLYMLSLCLHEGVLTELLYADDSVLMSKSTQE